MYFRFLGLRIGLWAPCEFYRHLFPPWALFKSVQLPVEFELICTSLDDICVDSIHPGFVSPFAVDMHCDEFFQFFECDLASCHIRLGH